MKNSRNVRAWIKGLVAGVIQGAANGITAGLAATGIAPDTFNLEAGAGNTLELAIKVAIIGGVLGAAAYLKQSPLPRDDELDALRGP